MLRNINTQQALFFSFLKKKTKPKKQKNIIYLIIVLIKMRLLIFLVFSQYRLACKYGNIFQISIYNLRRNCAPWYLVWQLPMRQGYNRNLIQLTFEIKDVFSLFLFEVDFVLKIEDNLRLFALSWIKIKHKTKHCYGENRSIVIIKCIKKKSLKGK